MELNPGLLPAGLGNVESIRGDRTPSLEPAQGGAWSDTLGNQTQQSPLGVIHPEGLGATVLTTVGNSSQNPTESRDRSPVREGPDVRSRDNVLGSGENGRTDFLSRAVITGGISVTEKRRGIIVAGANTVEQALLRSVIAGEPLQAIPTSVGELFSVPVISNRFKHTYGQYVIYKLFLEASQKAYQKGARQSLLGSLTKGYEAFTEMYRWKIPLLDEVGSRALYDPVLVLVLVRLDQSLENRMATLTKFVKKSTCPEDRKPLNVIAELYNLGKGGIRSAVLRYYRVPGVSKVRVELVATSLMEGDLTRYEVFPGEGETSTDLRLHDLDYPAVIVPHGELWNLVCG